MKKLFTLIALLATILSYNGVSAQCTLNLNNSTDGFTPTSSSIAQNASASGIKIEFYAPGSLASYTVDSVVVTSITGLPTGITYTLTPASGHILTSTTGGNGEGSICLSGSTSDAAGAYPFTFVGTVYTVQLGAVPISTVANVDPSGGFSYTLNVTAPAQTCDTLQNFTGSDNPSVFEWQSPSVGFIAGSGALSEQGTFYTQIGVAEEFTGTVGNYVTSAELAFGYITILPTDSDNTITVYVYDTSGTSVLGHLGAPGVALDSSKITLRQIASDVTGSYYSLAFFPNQPALTAAGFFIGISLPATTGDTLSLVTTDGTTPDGRGWLGANVGWIGLDSITGENIGSYIVVDVCPGQSLPPNAAFTNTAGCVNSAVTFTDNSTQSPAQWSWTFGDGGSSTAPNPTYTYTTTGTYTVVEYAGNANGYTIATNNITVNPSPSASVSVTNSSTANSGNGGATVTVTGGTSPYSYVWSNDNSTGDSIANVNPNTYNVTVTDANHCTTTASAVVITGINTLSNNVTIKIYPNPASDQLNFQWSLNAEADVVMYDVTGNAVKAFTINGTAVNSFDIHDLAAGTYVIRVTDRQNNEQRSSLFTKM